MSKHTTRPNYCKPTKDFPLTPHPSGRWCKRVRGRLYYFGPYDDPDGALARWLEQRDDLLAGREPRPPADGLSVADLCNGFLTSKRTQVDLGHMNVRSFGDYHQVCEHLVHAFGKHRLAADLRPPDFTTLLVRMSKGIGPVRRGNLVQRVRSVLKWAYESELIDKPIKTGPDFKKPKISILRKAKDERGPLMFSAAEIRRMLEAADPALKAMIYLGINGALGNTDCGSLQWRHIDFDRGWLTFPRPKTGIARRCPLWPETLEALRAAIAVRPQPKDDKYRDRIFVSDRGLPWTADATLREDGTTGPRIDCVTKAFRRLLDNLGLYRKRHGFYTLRHVFATIASSTLDQPAIDQITGHCDHAISAMYREYVADERLMRVAEHVRRWLTTSSGSPSNADASPTAVTSIS